jgi:spheroidene monooxygenase
MALARPRLRREPGLMFWKLCGAGSDQGFTFRADGRVWAILAAWADEGAARAGMQRPVWQRWRQHAAESWTVFLAPTSSRGSWAGVNPFLPDPAAAGGAPASVAGPWAALTRATLRPRHLLAFWRRVPPVSLRIGQDPDVVFKIGIGELPLVHQVTFSIWPDLASMARFARQGGAHAEAIRAVRDGDWFAEELYARFQVLGTEGHWADVRPRPAEPVPERTHA